MAPSCTRQLWQLVLGRTNETIGTSPRWILIEPQSTHTSHLRISTLHHVVHQMTGSSVRLWISVLVADSRKLFLSPPASGCTLCIPQTCTFILLLLSIEPHLVAILLPSWEASNLLLSSTMVLNILLCRENGFQGVPSVRLSIQSSCGRATQQSSVALREIVQISDSAEFEKQIR